MIVNELILTKEIFTNEVAENYYVVYAETLNKDIVLNNNGFLEKSRFIEKEITIFKGDSFSSLQKVKAYPLEHRAIESMREIIVSDLPELFTRAELESCSVYKQTEHDRKGFLNKQR